MLYIFSSKRGRKYEPSKRRKKEKKETPADEEEEEDEEKETTFAAAVARLLLFLLLFVLLVVAIVVVVIAKVLRFSPRRHPMVVRMFVLSFFSRSLVKFFLFLRLKIGGGGGLCSDFASVALENTR